METQFLDKNNNIPLYLQLMSIFMENIRKGIWEVGEKLPSEKELSNTYGVSLITVRKTLEELNKKNMIYKIQGKGSFVSYGESEKYNLRFKELRSFTEEMEQSRRTVGAVVLKMEEVPVDPENAGDFGIPEDTKVLRITRLRTVDGVPTHISTSEVFPGIGEKLKDCDLTQSIYGHLKRLGHQLSHGTEEIVAALPTREEAEYLKISCDTPVLDTRSVVEENGRAILITRSLINSKRMKITVDLAREE